jgi:hypothetical protein
MNEPAEPVTAGTVPVVAALGANPPGVQPNYMLALDTGADSSMSSVVLSGRPGSAGRLLYIQRSDTVTPTGSVTPAFSWVGDTISYITDINKDGTLDFIIPCPGSGGGDRICLYYGLGKSNYTSVNIYWTDTQPEVLGARDWLLNPPQIGPNSIQLSIDPLLFYDLARQPPYVPQGFNVDFVTATTGIDLLSNPNHLGVVTDILSTPVNVKMESGFLDDEQNSPRASQNVAPNPSQDIVYWSVEVI